MKHRRNTQLILMADRFLNLAIYYTICLVKLYHHYLNSPLSTYTSTDPDPEELGGGVASLSLLLPELCMNSELL